MNNLTFSFIIPVYNRPDEVEKLLSSIEQLDFQDEFEVVIIEDGSAVTCEDVCLRFRESIKLSYHFKPNSGPGDSRNYGMQRAKGNYFIILDSDCILPKHYLRTVAEALNTNYVDCYGGPDAAHKSFSNLQKAINYSMTSLFTTGGIRGGGERLDKFQPRSFNMGLSQKAFESTGGFGKIHPGEDPDLSIRLWAKGFHTRLIKDAFVYHERRISWQLFYKQVYKFGAVRVILNKWHPSTKKVIYLFPSLFVLGFIVAVLLMLVNIYVPILLYALYLSVIFIHSSLLNGPVIGAMSVWAVGVQFLGYGYGYMKSTFYLNILNRKEQEQFPNLFFK